MSRFLLGGIAMLMASPAFASLPTPPVAVPEISAVAATGAIAGVGAIFALAYERRKRNEK